MRITILPAMAVLAALCAALASAQAGEICIRCTGPEQTYRCSVLGADAPADQRRLGFFCASRIAQDEDHATCAAVRKEKQCQGAPRSYVYDATARVPGPLADERTEDQASEHEQDGPPRTVVDLTRETARQTEESLEKAADRTVETTRTIGERVRDAAEGTAGAVENATRATIRCIGSLFDDC